MVKCPHTNQMKKVSSEYIEKCTDCVKSGSNWVEVRKCMTCGYGGCCGSSAEKHAQKHYKKTDHPIIDSNKGAGWKWCYICDDYIEE